MSHKLVRGDKFTIDAGGHAGRTYIVASLAPNKWGIVHAVCHYSDYPGNTVLFSERDLNEYGNAFQIVIPQFEDLDAELHRPLVNNVREIRAARQKNYVCQLCFKPSSSGTEHRFCALNEKFQAEHLEAA